jgi:3-hydroxyisobutyrate dehydrogenase-like beta-hydroxyacid dehydrogenase
VAGRTTGQTISVIGLGAMRTALAKAFLAHKHRVTVWNRTASKCTPFAHAGVQIAPTRKACWGMSSGP